MPWSHRAVLVPGLVLALLLGACGGGDPSNGGTSGPASPTSAPTSGPGPQIVLTSGTATVEVGGGPTLELPLNVAGTVYLAPPNASSVAFADPAFNTFGISGLLASGATSTTLGLTVTTVDPPAGYTSFQGECTLEFDELGDEGFIGSFECAGVPNAAGDGEPADLSGTFEARS
ncbi:MAG: hypothetical protein WD770_05705 [Actinomycetota bacterium]